MASEWRRKRPRYIYIPLAEISNSTLANVFGVVKYYKKPFLTTKNDLCLTVKLVDQSLPFRDDGEELEGGLQCNFFVSPKNEKRLPQIFSVGDVVRFHRLSVGNFNCKPQGSAGPGFSWIVAHANGRIDSSNPNCTLTDEDEQRIKGLQEWGQSLSEVKIGSRITLLKDVCPDGNFINIIGQVISWHTTSDKNCIVLRLCDGTKPEFYTFYYCAQDLAQELLYANIPNAVESRTVNLHVYENHMETARKIKAGDFVHVTNVKERPITEDLMEKSFIDHLIPPQLPDHPEGWVGLMVSEGCTYGRGIRILKADDPEVCTVKERLKQVLEEEMGNEDDKRGNVAAAAAANNQSAPNGLQEKENIDTSSSTRLVTTSSNPVTLVTTSSNPATLDTTSSNPATLDTTSSNSATLVKTSSNPATLVTTSSNPARLVKTSSSSERFDAKSSKLARLDTTSSSPANRLVALESTTTTADGSRDQNIVTEESKVQEVVPESDVEESL